ncbi:MAG TPA: succinate dehydrogenase/fumarate reductase iron-sulfur subunit [Nitrososphaerales archaeon]|nr:succinate dehydrogenase/fumarate reductase iron-sulfur subunit [Nitrososphaerales archaeon]
MDTVRVRVQRYRPGVDGRPTFESFIVPFRRGTTVLDCVLHARDYVDHSIGVRFSCRMASCGSCGMKVNGLPRLACSTQVSELGTETITVQPMDNFPIIKDLVTDLAGFFSKHEQVSPHLVRSDVEEQDNPSSEYLMTPKELESILQFTYCIKCGLCTSSCPTVATDRLYPGPQALAQAYRYSLDVRDEGGAQRFAGTDTEHGVWRCHYAGSCSAVCPKGVDPALGIQLLKRHVMSGKAPRRGGEGSKTATTKS